MDPRGVGVTVLREFAHSERVISKMDLAHRVGIDD